MNASPAPDYSPAALVNRLFAAKQPETAAAVAPLVERLFAAQDEGHAFIYLNAAEAESCRSAAPLVGGVNSGAPLRLSGSRLFTAKSLAGEQQLAGEIRRLSASLPLPQDAAVSDWLHRWFADPLAADQQAAAALTLAYRFVLISGGPGTGKTTTVAALLALLCRDGLPRIALTAPTGKAAARMEQALHGALARLPDLPEGVRRHLLSLQGQTVHRLLGLKPPQMLPEYGRSRPLALDVLVLDETSMMDGHLLGCLLAALPDGCRVVLLGDADQLPSVGAGAVLTALTDSPPLPDGVREQLRALLPSNPMDQLRQAHAHLRVSRRFDGQSGIGALARAVAAGQAETAAQAFAGFPAQLHHYAADSDPAALLLDKQAAYWQAVESGDAQAAFARQGDAVLLCALREDAEKINLAYRKLLQSRHGKATGAAWFAGQMLLITRNDPAQNLYNGDIGIVLADAENRLAAYFSGSGGIRRIALSALPEHGDAFALTVHKSQGSEYGEVLFAAPSQAAAAVSRALLYTAVTRAKQRFAYIGSMDSLKAACLNAEQRRTALGQWLYA